MEVPFWNDGARDGGATPKASYTAIRYLSYRKLRRPFELARLMSDGDDLVVRR
jgi:hypothetical protein